MGSPNWLGNKQCFKNRTGPADPTSRTVDRPQNRFDSKQKTVFDRTCGQTGQTDGRNGEPVVEPVVEPASFHNCFFLFFKLKQCRFDVFYIEKMSFYLELESL